MGSLVAAFLLGWGAVSVYLGWLAVQNARLQERQNELKKLLAEHDDADRFYSTAA